MTENIEDVLAFDPLATAEKITGKTYSGDHETSQLGFLLHLQHGQMKNDLLKELHDTYFGMPWNDFCLLIETSPFGFKEGLKESFQTEDGRTEQFRAWFEPSRGLVLIATSYRGEDLNSCSVYGQLKVSPGFSPWKILSRCSHGGDGDKLGYTYFSYDGREGLLSKLSSIDLQPGKEWCNPWMTHQHVWFVIYPEEGKCKLGEFAKFNNSRINRCHPELVKIMDGKGDM